VFRQRRARCVTPKSREKYNLGTGSLQGGGRIFLGGRRGRDVVNRNRKLLQRERSRAGLVSYTAEGEKGKTERTLKKEKES